MRRRIQEEQLQSLRENADKYPSLIPRFVQENSTPPPARISTPDSAATPVAKQDVGVVPRPLRHLKSAKETSSPIISPKALWRRSASADFDADRCRELQSKWVASNTSSPEVLAIDVKAKRLNKLPPLRASREAIEALSALAEKQKSVATATISLRPSFAQPTFSPAAEMLACDHHLDGQLSNASSNAKKTGTTNSPKDSTYSIQRSSATTTLQWRIYVYLLLLVTVMVLLASNDPWDDVTRGGQWAASMTKMSLQWTLTLYRHARPYLQTVALYCRIHFYETYILWLHVLRGTWWILGENNFHYGNHSLERNENEEYMFYERWQKPRRRREGDGTSAFDSRNAKEPMKGATSYWTQTGNSHQPFVVDTEGLAQDSGNFYENEVYCFESPLSYDWYFAVDNVFDDAVDLQCNETDHDERSVLFENEDIFLVVDPPGAEEKRIANFSRGMDPRLEVLSVVDESENHAIQEMFDRAIKSYGAAVEQLFHAIRNEDHTPRISSLLKEANWITLGSRPPHTHL